MSRAADKWQRHIDLIEHLDRQPRVYEPGDATPELIDMMKSALVDLLALSRDEATSAEARLIQWGET